MKLDHGRKVRSCTFLDVGGKASAVAAGGARPRHRKALARSSVRMVGDAVPEGGQHHSQMLGFGMENVAKPPAVGQTATYFRQHDSRIRSRGAPESLVSDVSESCDDGAEVPNSIPPRRHDREAVQCSAAPHAATRLEARTPQGADATEWHGPCQRQL